MKSIFALFLFVVVIHVAEMLIHWHKVEYVEFAFTSDAVPSELDGCVLAFVSDLHDISEAELAGVANRIKTRGVNVLLLGGDYASGGQALMNMRVLSAVAPPGGVFGVEGNHDHWSVAAAAMKENGVVPLDNTGVAVMPGLYVAGVHDLWNRMPDVAKAIRGRASGDFIVLLSHNPDVAMEQNMDEIGLTLSGHTHGGQISLFGLWSPALRGVTKYPALFSGGYVQTDGAHVIVSKGTGSLRLVPRVFSRQQVYFITLRTADKG